MADQLTRGAASEYTTEAVKTITEAVSSPPSVCSEESSESGRSGKSRVSDATGTGSPQTARDKARVCLLLLSGCRCMCVCFSREMLPQN